MTGNIQQAFSPQGIPLHSTADFAGMRRAGRLAAEVLDYITPYAVPGTPTEELDRLCHEYIIKHNAIPAPLNYKGFPKSICTSINHVVCHGIPGARKLADGDIVNIDVTVILDGWYGDTSRTYNVGNVSRKAEILVSTTYDAMMAGIAAIRPGNTFGDIAREIERVAHAARFSVVEDFCGHGIGKTFHSPPAVLHYFDEHNPDSKIMFEPGMFFTVEPMINAGKVGTIVSKEDGWTATTRDKSLSAQFEHTIGVTEDGYEIFTLSPKGYTKPPYA